MNGSPIRLIPGVLVGLATILAIVGISVAAFLNPVWVGFEQGRSGAAALTGYTTSQVDSVTGGILHDLVFGPAAFDETVNGAAVLDPRERSHMADVQHVFVAFGALVLLAILTLAGVRLVARRQAWFRRAVGVGAAVLAVGIVGSAVVAMVAFDQAFAVFHGLFFPAGSYDFDPATSRLVQLFPDAFWQETTLALGVVILAISLGVARWGLRGRTVA